MKAKKFEDLIIWQKSRELVNLIYKFTNNYKFKDLSLKDQIRRAAVSVLSNIAEGFDRGTKEELIHFLFIARASCGEVRAQLYVALDQNFINNQEFEQAKNLGELVSASTYKFIESVKVSKYKGLKFKQKKQMTTDEFLEEYLPKKSH
jgi:four helix bundle protein